MSCPDDPVRNEQLNWEARQEEEWWRRTSGQSSHRFGSIKRKQQPEPQIALLTDKELRDFIKEMEKENDGQ